MSRILKSEDTIITQDYKDNHGHNGVDVVGIHNTTCPVIAHSKGKVEMIQTGRVNNNNTTGSDTYGNFVKIKHSNGYSTLYAHLDKVYVQKGETVAQGQEIGYMGNTGRSYGAHLHFEVRTDGTYDSIISSAIYINTDLPGLEDREYKIIKDWQKCMNTAYKCGLAEDNLFGPDSKAKANKYVLKYKKPIIENEHVRFVQQRLKNIGYTITVDKRYGPVTKSVIMQFQGDRGIVKDGSVGSITTFELLK